MKKFYNVLIALVLMFTMTYKSSVKADAYVPLNITSVKVTDDNNVEYPPGSEVNQYDNLIVKINFTIPDGTVTEGAQSIITISDDLRFPSVATFTVYDPSETHPIAQATINGPGKIITLVYTDYAVGKQNVSGHIQFFSRVDFDVATSDRTVDITYSLNGTTIKDFDLEYVRNNDDQDEIMSKYQWFEDGVTDKYTSIIRVNPSQGTYTDVTIKDELRTIGTQYDIDSFVIKKGIWQIGNSGVWQLQGGVDVTSQYQINFSDDDSKFSIDFGAMGPTDQYRIEYRVKTNRIPVSGELFSNYVEMVDSTVVVEKSQVNTAYSGGGGSADGTVTISGEKLWVDGNDQDGLRPTSIVVNLLADGVKIDEAQVTKNLEGKWLYSFSNLPFLKNGVRIIYTVTEADVAGYTATYNGNTITNTHVPATTAVTGQKTWADANDQDGLRPTSITVNLLANGVKIDSVTVSEGSDGEWIYSFNNLPMYEDGVEIVYTVTEEPVTGYTTSYTGFNIANTHVPATTPVTGEKTWVDSNDQDRLRPTSITVNLLANGVKIDSVTVSEGSDGEWIYSFNNLPMYEDGVEIVYTITEEPVTGYTTSYTGFNITNTVIPKGDTDELPVTGVANNYSGNFMVIAGISLLLVSYSKKKRRA